MTGLTVTHVWRLVIWSIPHKVLTHGRHRQVLTCLSKHCILNRGKSFKKINDWRNIFAWKKRRVVVTKLEQDRPTTLNLILLYWQNDKIISDTGQMSTRFNGQRQARVRISTSKKLLNALKIAQICRNWTRTNAPLSTLS